MADSQKREQTMTTLRPNFACGRLCFAVAVMVLLGASPCFAGDWTNWILGKKGLGADSPCFPSCPKCDDYCPKPLVCTPKVCTQCAEPYCAKPIPCVTGPKACLPGCYCPKPLPPFCESKCPPHWSPLGGR